MMTEENLLTGKTGYIDLTRLMFSAVVVLYFALIIAINQVTSSVLSGAYYLVLALAVVLYYVTKKEVGLGRVLIYAMGSLVCGTCNMIFAGNLTPLKMVITFLSFLLAVFFLDEAVDPRAFRIAFDMNLLLISAKILMNGRTARVFVDSSNNYVSIHLLVPLVLYYAVLDTRGKKTPLLPAVCSWVLSLIAGGRGGLLACTILLGGMLISRLLSDEVTRRERIIFGLAFMFVMIPVLLILLELISERFSGLYVVSRFTEKGLDGGGRLDCWMEYISKTMQSFKRILFGTPLDEVKWAIYYHGNLHNSYLLVHSMFGAGGLLFILIMLCRTVIWAIRNRRWVYMWSILAFAFRGLTDRMFGGNRLSVVLLTLILLPEVFRWQEKKKQEMISASPEALQPVAGEAESL